jgi:hypothetical protein
LPLRVVDLPVLVQLIQLQVATLNSLYRVDVGVDHRFAVFNQLVSEYEMDKTVAQLHVGEN